MHELSWQRQQVRRAMRDDCCCIISVDEPVLHVAPSQHKQRMGAKNGRSVAASELGVAA